MGEDGVCEPSLFKADFGVKGSAFGSKFEDLMPRVRIGFGVLVQSFKLTLGRCHDVSQPRDLNINS